MSYWERVPLTGERQYLTQVERNDQWINEEEEAATQTNYKFCPQQSEIDIQRYDVQRDCPPSYNYDHKIHRNTYWPHEKEPLRGKLPHNVTIHKNGEMENKQHEKEPYFSSFDFSPLSIFEKGHEDVSHHTNADRGYVVGPEVNRNNYNPMEHFQQMYNSIHSNSNFQADTSEFPSGFSKGASHGCDGGSYGSSSGGSSRGGSEKNCKGNSTECSIGLSKLQSIKSTSPKLQAKHDNTSSITTKLSLDIQNTNIDATISAGNKKHCEMALRPITSCVQASTVMESTMSVDLEVAQVAKADINGVTEPSLPLKDIMQLTDTLSNAALVPHTQTSATPERKQVSCSSPKDFNVNPQRKPSNTNLISFKKIQDWIQSVQTESKNQQQLKTNGKSMSSDQLCAEESTTVQLEIKSNHRSMTLTAVAAILPPVAIVPPMGSKQSPEPLETGSMDKEFQNLKASIKEQSVESPQASAKDYLCFPAVLHETGTFQKRVVCHKPVDTSLCSQLSAKQDIEFIQVISKMDNRSPSPYVHTSTTVNDVNEAQTIMEVGCNSTDGTINLLTIGDIQFKLSTLRQLVNDLEGSVTNEEAKDSCLKTVLLKQYWGDDVEALKNLTDHKIMQDVSAWAIEDENAVVLFAVSGFTLQELVTEFPNQGQVDSSLLVDYRSSWLNINEKLDDIDKESGRVCSLGFRADKAEENASTEVVDRIKIDNSFLSKTDTIVLTPQQPVDKELIKDGDPQNDKIIMEINSPTDTDLPLDADSKKDPLSNIILTVLTPDDALKLIAEIEEPDKDLSTDKDAKTGTDLLTDIDTHPPMNLTVLTSEDALKLMCQIEKDSAIELGSPAPSYKTQTELLQNVGSGRFEKPCNCPCFIETDNGFEVVLCFSCQEEKISPQSLRCKPIIKCFNLLNACGNSDQETEKCPTDLAPSCLPPNQSMDLEQRKTTKEKTDDKQSSDHKTEEEMLKFTSVIHTSDILFLSDESQDSDQETPNKSGAEHKTESATCMSAKQCTSQSEFDLFVLGSENRKIPKNDQDFQLGIIPLLNVKSSTHIADNWCSPIEDSSVIFNSLRDEYDTITDFVNHHKPLKPKEKVNPNNLKEHPLNAAPSVREESKIGPDGGEKGQSQTPPHGSPEMKVNVEKQQQHKKPHASQKKRHLTEVKSDNHPSQNKFQKFTEQRSKNSQSKNRKLPKKHLSTVKECEDHHSRHKRTSPGEGSQASQLRNKKSLKRASTEAEGRYCGDSKEFEPQQVKRMKRSSESFSVKIFPVQESLTSTASPKLSINVYDELNRFHCKGNKEVSKMLKTDTSPKKSRHPSPKGQKILSFQKAIVRNASPPNQEMVQGSLLKLKRLEGSSSSQKRRKEDKACKPGGTGVKALLTRQSSEGKLDQSKLLKSKAVSVLTSEKLKVTPKALDGNEEEFKKIITLNDPLLPKPTLQRIPKLSKTKNIQKHRKKNENRQEASTSDFPEPQMLNEAVRVLHKPKPLNKPSSPNGSGPSTHAFPHLTGISSSAKIYFAPKISARQHVLTDWENSFVPTKPPSIRRKSGCLLQGVEEQHASHGTRILKPILKRVDSQPKPKLKVNFPLNPRRVWHFRRHEFEADVMFNKSWTDYKDANPSKEQDAQVDSKNAVEQAFVRKETMQDRQDVKPGASSANEKMFKIKRQMPEQATHLVKKCMVQAKIWTNSIHHEPPKKTTDTQK
ncbi:hypothetical protein UPYG_G00343020 [Umbra pygmaea]|uniref:Uncharacterized protein n=1 Tax=Umbra pygmaea TaxID=75934 RepID=A0ABD0VX87_UMBPY